MSTKKELKAFEELSAYLDGEAANPAEVKRRIDNDPDTARMADALSTLSKEVGDLPAPEIHPAFRTRVLAHVREEPRDVSRPVLSWPWRALAAMVVIAPFAAGVWTFWISPPAIPPAESQRALVHYLLEQDEEVVLDELAAMYVNGTDWIDADWTETTNADTWESVEESVWLDVLAMDPTFVAWSSEFEDSGWDGSANSFSEDELQKIELLLMHHSTGDTTT